MTIARDTASEQGFDDVRPQRAAGAPIASEMLVQEPVPVEIRADRLTRQITHFERAGYRLETRSALQAVVVKPREARPLRDALLVVATLGLTLLPRVFGAGRVYHRVVITVDRRGAVRFA